MQTNLHSVLTVTMQFFFGLISPGPNFLVVAQTALNFGGAAGLITGLGAALGDAVYANIGFFGVTQLARVSPLMIVIDFVGGLYLVWLEARMLSHRVRDQLHSSLSVETASARAHFWPGLATDLANPKTALFLAGIFAIAVSPTTTGTVPGNHAAGNCAHIGFVALFVSLVFSTTAIRKLYERTERVVVRMFGAALCLFGTAFW
jgi:threonine/homoserine/homoserine lactone efflux protein